MLRPKSETDLISQDNKYKYILSNQTHTHTNALYTHRFIVPYCESYPMCIFHGTPFNSTNAIS